MILLECCCGRPVPPELVGCVFNHPVVMSNLIWAVVALVVLLVLGICIIRLFEKKNELKQENAKDAREHELNLKKLSFENEKYWHEKGQEDKENALDLRIREFEELTLHQKLLDKVIEKSIDEKVEGIDENLKDLQRKYESLKGEIEQIIIKKKQ